MEKIIERLKFFKAERNLTIEEIAKLIDKDPKTVWQFLNQKTRPHSNTLYKIKKLLGEK